MSVLGLVRMNIRNITPYSSARDEFTDFDTEMIFLDANENPFETDVNRYPDPQQKTVKNLLSKQKKIPEENILLGNGSDEVLDLLIRAFCEPTIDSIITLPPTYGMYEFLANINAVATKKVQLTPSFQPEVSQILLAAETNSKLLFLCSPNNPTGNSFMATEVEHLLKNFNGIVIIDEAYIDFSETKSWLDRLNEFPNLVITQTLSKAYGMAGIRLGVCYASVEIISVLNSIKPPYNVNQLTQLRALHRLNDAANIISEIQLIKAERRRLIDELNTIEFVKKVYPTDVNFVFVQVDNATKRYQQLIAEGIVIRNRTHQVLCNNCLRISIGTLEENNQLINVLQQLS